MPALKAIEHQIIFKDPFAYCAHPFIASLPDGEWVVVFNRSVRRPFLLHPPNDPHYYNVLIRSSDRGRTWSSPRVVPSYDWYGVECAGLTVLAGGTLMLNQWRFRWYPLEAARKLAGTEPLSFPEDWVAELQVSSELDTVPMIPEAPSEIVPWARGSDGTYVHLSADGGRTWDKTVQIATMPYSGGYGMRGAVQLANGDILLPLSDVPNYRTVFIVRSTDGGYTWDAPVEAASEPGKQFEEPSILALSDGTLIMMLRENSSRAMHRVVSSDGGYTWSKPESVSFQGYPAHLLRLPDERILCVYGYRYAPYGIRAVISSDGGQTWNGDAPLILRDDLPNRDLGYPAAILADDGSIFAVYYGQDKDGVTCIQGTRFTLDG